MQNVVWQKTPSGVSKVRAGVNRIREERRLSFEACLQMNGDAGVNIDFAGVWVRTGLNPSSDS